jgi:hypothetical protein
VFIQEIGATMIKIKCRIAVIGLLLFVLLLNCGDQSEKAIDFGEHDSGLYTNEFFNLALNIPENWYNLSLEQRIEIMRKGGQIIAGEDKNLKAAINASDLESLNLLTAYAYPPGTPTTTNPGFMIIAEKIKRLPGIKRGKDYHYHTRKMIELSPVNATFGEDIYEVIIDGVPFDVIEFEIDVGNIKIMQKQYATIMKGYALVFAVIYQDDEGLYQLEEILQTISLS